jgi:uncharacterized protein YndB with AHSA1/START domain
MYSFSVAVEIAAPPSRVWRALCDPVEVVQWDTGVAGAIDAPADYPRPGQHVRWRYANGPFRTLHDRPQEVVPDRTLRSLISVGPTRMDETYTLEAADGGTRLTAAMLVRVPWPVAGALAARWVFGPAARKAVTASLAAIKRHCERGTTG